MAAIGRAANVMGVPAGKPKTAPGPLAPAQTNIGGQTYLHSPGAKHSVTGENLQTGYQAGTKFGADGSAWVPVPGMPGAGGRGPGPGGGGGGGNPFDFWTQYNLAANKVPQIPPRVPQIPDADRTAAEAAAFGRAKDRIGLATQGLMKSIRNRFASRGISGSPLAMSAESGALEAGHGQIADTIREQAIQGLDRQYDVRDQNYQGDLTQRGQDISAENARQQLVLSLVRAAFESGRY